VPIANPSVEVLRRPLESALFTTTALVVMFASDLHHVLLRALASS
jgi:flagellar biosynthesis protein FliR